MSRRASSLPLPSARLGDPHHGLRRLAGDGAIVATVATVSALFLVSPVTMEHFGLSYITSGGGALSKFHPSTFLSVLAFALRCLAARSPARTAWRLCSDDAGIILLVAAVAVAVASAAIISKTPVTPVVDTFILPILCFVLLRDLDATLVKWIALLVAAILSVNAVLGLIEFLTHTHFVTLDIPEGVSSDPTRGDVVFNWRAELMQDWRATALLGHPLVNGLVVGGFILCLVAPGARWLPFGLRAALVALQAASMFAFGARTSLVLAAGLGTCLLLWSASDALARGARITPRALAMALVLAAVAIGVVAVVADTGFFDHTIERFASDAGSAKTRFTMFELFGPIPWSDLLLAPDKEVVATWQRLYGLEFGIESTWIGLALTYGLVVTAIIVVGLAAFSASIMRRTGRGTAVLLLFYFISVSGTASMSGKTTTFAMFVVLAVLFLRKDETPLPLRSALGLEAP